MKMEQTELPSWNVLEVKRTDNGKTVSVHITEHHPPTGKYLFTLMDELEKRFGEGYEVWQYDKYFSKKKAFDTKHRLQSYIQDITDRERGLIYNKGKK